MTITRMSNTVTQVVLTPDRPKKDTARAPTHPPTSWTPGLKLRPSDILKLMKGQKVPDRQTTELHIHTEQVRK